MSADIDDVEANVKTALEEAVVEDPPADPPVEDPPAEDPPADPPAEDPPEPEFSEKEQEAMDLGWRPDGKDRDGNTLSAEEYLARKPLFNKIHNLNEKLDDQSRTQDRLQKQIETLSEHNKKIAEAKIKEREAFLEQLKDAKEQALTDLNVAQVREIDTQIDQVREEISTQPVFEGTEATPEVSPAAKKFVEENDWYETDMGLATVADDIGKRLVQEKINAGVKPEDILQYETEILNKAADEVKALYPHKFEKPKARQPRVGSNRNRQPIAPVETKKTLNDLPEDQQAIAREVMESTGQTEDQYLETYKF